ncbi:apoptosis antagonizing transcription factor-domain-containing protein [Aspergillus unguis]
MAPKSLAEQIADLEDLTPRDYDPEDIERGGNSSDEEGDVKDASAGREHYQAVGKAKLRNEDPVSLGKQYAGSRVSRDALDAESDEDPFKARDGETSDEDEDDDESEGDEDQSEGDDLDGSEDEDDDEDEEEQDGSDDDEMDEDDEESESSDEDDSAKRKVKFADASDDRALLRQLMATDQKTIAASISQAAKADATKGRAVKQQRATFDALLNARIKLQKGLAAANQISAAQPEETDGDALKSAESAALTLWSTLEDLRLTLVDAQTQDESKKRKRAAPPTPSTSTSSLWKRMTELETDSLAHRRAILDKWSSKVRGSGSTLASSKTKLIGASAAQQTITAVLDAHVASETADLRAAKKARKSSDSGASNPAELEYDDTIFYQSLLRDLVSQRMSSSDAITNGLDTLHLLPSRNVHHVTGMRKDKTRREVDTRASKGRKMRFDVHEKLQNFMAPEDRGVWTGRAREEFFASLLGRTASGLLREDEGSDEGAGESDSGSEDEVEGGLRLFRS